ncbi:hypothetical protein ACXX82_17240 [Glaciimonas sp. GNP009]
MGAILTLVIAGHNYIEKFKYEILHQEEQQVEIEMESDGLFVVADSAITSITRGVEKTLLNGLRKIYDVEINVWKPYFGPGGTFYDYKEVYQRASCFIAFAGSTLTALHVLNSITEHLRKLRISHERTNGQIKYCIIRHCALNPLDASSTYYSDDTFLNEHFTNLLTADVVSDVIEYSINEAIRSAAKYKLDIDEFNAMRTELIAGIWCEASKKHRLYAFRWQTKTGVDGVLFPFTEKELVKEDEIVVLGLRELEDDAQAAFNSALDNFKESGPVLFEFLNVAIDDAQKLGSKYIDRPSVLKSFNRGSLKVEKHSR